MKNIEIQNPNKKHRMLVLFNDMIVDMFSNKNLDSVVTKLFLRGTKLDISLVFIKQSYSKVPKGTLNTAHFFIVKT